MICFLAATSFSTLGIAQDNPVPGTGTDFQASSDLAQQLYGINLNIIKQQGILESKHERLLEAIKDYQADGTPASKNYFVRAANQDAEAVQKYLELVQDANTKIQQASGKYYEETPATEAEIDIGPSGKKTPPGGESIAHEIPEPPPIIVRDLKTEVKANGGLQSTFAEQLREQQRNLKNTKAQIEKELNSPAVKNNPTARQQDMDLRAILEKAIEARREVIGEE